MKLSELKCIAVDMDGTFLSSSMEYNRERFEYLYQKMKKRGITFIVASGNQYQQLKSFFPKFEDEIIFVAENGGIVVDKKEYIFHSDMPRDVVNVVLKNYWGKEDVLTVVATTVGTFIKRNSTFYAEANKYAHVLMEIDDIDEIDVPIVKINIAFDGDGKLTDEHMDRLKEMVDGKLTVVTSGHGSIDVISSVVDKSTSIELVGKKYGFDWSNTMVFGDGGNDLTMLRKAAYSYAMANGSDLVKQTAKYQAKSNNDEGVLEVIDQWLTNETDE